MGAMLGEPGSVKEGSGAPLSRGASPGNLGEGSYARGLCVEEGSGTGISPYRDLVGEPGKGDLSTGNFEN